MQLNSNFGPSFFRRFLFSYIFILAVPILMAFLFYYESIDSVFEESLSANKAMIGQTTLILDKSLEEIEHLMAKLSLDNEFLSLTLSEPPLSGRFYYNMTDVVTNIDAHITTRAFLSSYFIYLPNSEQVLVSNTSYNRDFFFTFSLKYLNYTEQDWLQYLDNNDKNMIFLPSALISLDGFTLNSIPLVMRFPIRYHPGSFGLIVFFIDNAIFQEYLCRAKISEDVSIYVTDENSVLITQLGGSDDEYRGILNKPGSKDGDRIKTKEGKKLIVRSQSDYSGLTYTVLTPESVILHRLHYIRNSAIVITAFTILAGILLALYFSNRNAKPLVSILDVLKSDRDEGDWERGNPFESLQKYVSNLVSDNSNLNDRVTVQRAHLREITLLRILNGEFKNSENIEKSIEFLSLDIKADLYGVVCLNLFRVEESFSMNTVEEGLLGKLLLDDLLQVNERGCKINIVTLGESQFSLVFSCYGSDKGICRINTEEILQNAIGILGKEYGISPVWGGGTFVDSLDMISISNDYAREVLNRISLDSTQRGLWYTESKRETTDIHYPTDIENRIMFLIKSGEFDSFSKLIENNFNFNKHLLNEMLLKKHYFNLLKNSFYRMNIKIPQFTELSQRMQSLDLKASSQDLIDEILAINQEMCSHINRNKKSRNTKLKDDILEFLQENYSDINISLISVASHFNVSSGYLSHFFKEQTGTNFSTFLENIRIEKAVELLENDDVKIQDMVRMVGYSNAYSFRRAFKKITGVSPSQYRDR